MSFMKIHPALAKTLHGAIHGQDAAPDCAKDMSPEDWHGLVHGFLKFISEEEREPEHKHGAEDAPNTSGKLTEAEQSEAAKGHAEREEMPASAFLETGERKYPVKEKRDGEWKYSRNLLLAAAREARMHGHEDLATRADKIRGGMAQDSLAFDSPEANRTKTEDGRLIVKLSNFSKSNVCGYLGREIPDYESLGLDPDKVYQLWRHPEELKKAAPTFDKVPVLSEHQPVIADSYPSDIIIGTTGEKTRFVAPYLQGSLAIWSGSGVADIESGRKSELSCGYKYQADLTPGRTPDGVPYDGVMRALVGNHIAIVTEGRAGSDCFVGDENPFKEAGRSGDSTESVKMKTKTVRLSPMAAASKGAIVAVVKPIMAADAKVDFGALVKGVTKKGWGHDKARILAALPAAIRGKGPKLATDADVGPIVAQVEKLLDTINPAEEGMDDEMDDGAMDAWSDEDQKAYDELCARREKAGAMDEEEETEEEKKMRMEKRAADKAARDAEMAAAGGEKSKVTKEAMDALNARIAKIAADSNAAIAKAQADAQSGTIATILAIDEAKIAVRPLVGDIAVPMSSPEMVFDHALKSAGQDVTGINLAGKKALVTALVAAKATVARPANSAMGLDAAGATNLDAFRKSHGLTARPVKRA